jgi:hypothetical protein
MITSKHTAVDLREVLRDTLAALERHFDGTCNGTEVKAALRARDALARHVASTAQPAAQEVGAVASAPTKRLDPRLWHRMDTAPRDGTVLVLRWGEDGESPGWWDSPITPVRNDDGTYPREQHGHPWAFIDRHNGRAIVNHARDTEYGPSHWTTYESCPTPARTAAGDADALATLRGMRRYVAYARCPQDLPADTLARFDAAIERLASAPGDVRVPEGWALVPRDPTIAMLTAMSLAEGMTPLGDGSDGGYPITGQQSTIRQVYAAMLAAAPQPGDSGRGG